MHLELNLWKASLCDQYKQAGVHLQRWLQRRRASSIMATSLGRTQLPLLDGLDGVTYVRLLHSPWWTSMAMQTWRKQRRRWWQLQMLMPLHKSTISTNTMGSRKRWYRAKNEKARKPRVVGRHWRVLLLCQALGSAAIVGGVMAANVADLWRKTEAATA